MKNVTVVLERKATGGSKGMAALYLVKNNRNIIIGLLEKYNNTRTETHPWKAFKGYGKEATFLGSFYKEEGGKQAAIDAIMKYETKLSTNPSDKNFPNVLV